MMIPVYPTLATTCFVVLGGDNPEILSAPYVLEYCHQLHCLVQYDSPTINKNALVPIIVKAANREVANNYFSYHRFIKDSYTDFSALCEDIDCAEREIGKIEGQFYPVVEGNIQGKSVKMVYTSYP
jgi:hypothetical protein